MNKIEKKMKKRIDNNLNKLVKNPYVKPKKTFPLWGKILIPLGSSLVAATACLAIILPFALKVNGASMKDGQQDAGYSGEGQIAPTSDKDAATYEGVESLPAFKYLTSLRTPTIYKQNQSDSKYYSGEYTSFKRKMNVFSQKMTEYFIDSKYQNGTNIAFSPLSIELCLGLAVRASGGNTRTQLLNAFDVDYSTFNRFYKNYFEDVYAESFNDSGEETLISRLVNSIWINNDVPLLDEGLDALRDDYYSYSYYADFSGHNEETNREMSDFVSRSTDGFIAPSFDFDRTTLFVLMNTVYWCDFWNRSGDDLVEAGSAYKFTNSDDTVSEKKLYESNETTGRVLKQEKYNSFYSFTKGGFKLYFVKPNEGYSASDVLNNDDIAYFTNSNNYTFQDDLKHERYHTKCVFPEFNADFDGTVTEILVNKFNISDLFSYACDLSNLIDESKAVINAKADKVKHIARIEVTKKSIKAAAVTTIDVPGASAPDDYTDIHEKFIIDKEFGFVLSYKDAILFSGIISNIDK